MTTPESPTGKAAGAVPILHVYLAATAAREMEAALQRHVGACEGGLRDAIEAWRCRGAPRALVAAAHYLRRERNHVLHHPARPLADAARFRSLAQQVLHHLASPAGGMPAPAAQHALPETMGAAMVDEMRRNSQAGLAELVAANQARLAELVAASQARLAALRASAQQKSSLRGRAG